MTNWIDSFSLRNEKKDPPKTTTQKPRTPPVIGAGITLDEVQEAIRIKNQRLLEYDKSRK